MIVRRGKPWAIVATFVLVASVSASFAPRYSTFPDRAGDTNKSSTLRNSLVPSRNIYPRNHERFAPNSSPEQPRAVKYKRYVVLSGMIASNASDPGPGKSSEPSQNVTLARVPLHRSREIRRIQQATTVTHHGDPISSFRTDDHARTQTRRRRAHCALCVTSSSRTRRSPATATTAVDDQPWKQWRNASDYYAERRAVMARFYARQREIEARYGNFSSFTSRPDQSAVTSDGTLFRLYPSRNSNATDNGGTFRHPSITIDPVYSNLASRLDRRPVVQEAADRRLESRLWNISNVEGQIDRYRTVTPVPCANASLSGTLAPKKRSKTADGYTSDKNDVETTVIGRTRGESNGSDHEIWGECKGKVVYQHNLLLGLKGPSTLDTVFEVIIQGPVCITCVETVRYNETRAKVTFESGGRGYNYVKLKLQGYENEGFSYIIKVWGIRKFDPDCSNM